MDYLIIEPHSDDAYLSLHNFIRNRTYKHHTVRVLTIFSNTKRAREGAEYCEQFGVRYTWAGLEETNCGLTNTDENLIPQLKDVVKEYLEEKAHRLFKKKRRILCPIGLQHPEHIAVSDAVCSFIKPDYFYAEIPYYSKRKLKEEFESSVIGLTNDGYSLLDSEQDPLKHGYSKYFKSQSLFFYYNKPWELSAIPERVYARV